MRVAVVVVLILLAAPSSRASDSCMTKDEARNHFGTSYLYWHGPDHCWDASPSRRPSARNIQQQNVQKENVEALPKVDPVPRKDSNWREARSELVIPVAAPPIAQPQPLERNEVAAEDSVSVSRASLAKVPHRLNVQKTDRAPSSGSGDRSTTPAVVAASVILILLSCLVLVATREFRRNGTVSAG
jgi:hypothetical protein